jgi:hypothetical protein
VAAATVTSTLLVSAGRKLSTWFKRRQQRRRDRRANALVEAARVGNAPDFSFYLRAFETTGRMHETKDVGALAEFEATDFETELAEAVEKDIPLVALGQPGEQVGAGRWPTSDAMWQTDVQLLTRAALVLFMLPSTRAGTLWELDWIMANRLLGKTVFIQPPYRRKRWYVRGKTLYDWEAAWNEIRKAGLERSMRFPEFARDGGFFTFATDGTVATYTAIGTTHAVRLARGINRQLKEMAKLRAATAG